MSRFFDIDTIASAIYTASCDLDYNDYTDTAESDLNDITSALSKVRGYADYNKDFEALANALSTIFDR